MSRSIPYWAPIDTQIEMLRARMQKLTLEEDPTDVPEIKAGLATLPTDIVENIRDWVYRLQDEVRARLWQIVMGQRAAAYRSFADQRDAAERRWERQFPETYGGANPYFSGDG
eukprot:tig00020965_g16903.t1